MGYRVKTVVPRDEQLELARRAATGDRQAAGRLIEASRGFILQRVRRLGAAYLRADPSWEDDLYNEGCRGMFEALLRYDVEKNVHPLTYCAHWVDLRIRNALTMACGPASVGSPQHWRELGRPHTTAVSLEGITETVPDDTPLADEQLAAAAMLRERRGQLASALRHLDPTDRRIVELRLLADPADRRTLVEVGHLVGLSRERTRQREIAALKQLLELLGAASGRLSAVRKLSRG